MAYIWNLILIIFPLSSGLMLNGTDPAGRFQEPFTLICFTPIDVEFLTWSKNAFVQLATITGIYSNGSCKFDGKKALGYMFTCDPSKGLYSMTISGTLMTNTFHNTTFQCEDSGAVSNVYTLSVNIPVSIANLVFIPHDGNPIQINETVTQTFRCTTNAIRPGATINWFIGAEHITNIGTDNTADVQMGLVVSSSDMKYTGTRNDNNKILYCTASNIGNSVEIESDKKILQINYGPNQVIILPSTPSYTVIEIVDSIGPISCTTDCNPSCTTIWSGPNLFVSTSSLLNIRNIKRNQSGEYQCTASNFLSGNQSLVVIITVEYGPNHVNISPSTPFINVNETVGNVGPITCTADCRPNCTIIWSGPNISVGNKSVLYIQNIKRTQAGYYQCTASNFISIMQSIVVSISVQYGPNNVTLSPSSLSYSINETLDNVGPITCTADCKPICTTIWSGRYIPVGTSSVLYIQNIKRTQAGYYQCTAINFIGSLQSKVVSVIVQYGPDKVIISPSTPDYFKNETTDSVGPISCSADCIPDCKILWYGPNIPVRTSSLLYLQKIQRNQSGDYQCEASNVVSSMHSITVSIIVYYGPTHVNISPFISSYTVNETVNSVGSIFCTADCKPNCTMIWSGPNIPFGTTSVLYLQNIQRNQSGDYQCRASNAISSMQSTTVSVTVQYGPSLVTISPTTASYTVTEKAGRVGPVDCQATCNPKCTITWSGPNFPSSTNVLNLQNINRTHAGDYQCIAKNVVSSLQSSAITIVVNWKPTLNPDVLSSPSVLAVNIGMPLNITINVIANPSPNIEWFFEDNNFITNITALSDVRSRGFQHRSTVIIATVDVHQFGLYTVEISNGIGHLTRTFSVVQKEQPTAPSFVYVFCTNTAATLLWRSASNGGSTQHFKVQFWKLSESAILTIQQNISDPGFDLDQQFIIKDLSVNTQYWFTIQAINEIGLSKSKTVNCTTTEQWQNEENSQDTRFFKKPSKIKGLEYKRSMLTRSENYADFQTTDTELEDTFTTLNDTDLGNQKELEDLHTYEECKPPSD